VSYFFVMAGLVPAIHVFVDPEKEGVDARDKPGHDVMESLLSGGLRNGLPNAASAL
jgi:hypothetical protein